MANRFLNNIKINDSYTLPAADGTADQVITTDGSGQLSFVDQSTLAADSAEVVEVPVKKILSGLDHKDSVSKDSLKNPESIDWFLEFYKNQL